MRVIAWAQVQRAASHSPPFSPSPPCAGTTTLAMRAARRWPWCCDICRCWRRSRSRTRSQQRGPRVTACSGPRLAPVARVCVCVRRAATRSGGCACVCVRACAYVPRAAPARLAPSLCAFPLCPLRVQQQRAGRRGRQGAGASAATRAAAAGPPAYVRARDGAAPQHATPLAGGAALAPTAARVCARRAVTVAAMSPCRADGGAGGCACVCDGAYARVPRAASHSPCSLLSVHSVCSVQVQQAGR